MKSTSLARIFGWIAFVSALLTVGLLGLLHVLSPEFDPSWRMVSEYANGSFGGVLAAFFAIWGISSLALVVSLRSHVKTRGGNVGLVLLTIAGTGQILAALFDINHPLHGLVGNLAIPTFAIAAVLITRSLAKATAWKSAARKLMILAHLCWISIILLVVSFVVLMTTYANSGADVAAGTSITVLPEGVVAFVGWTNRLLVVMFAVWTAATAFRVAKR